MVLAASQVPCGQPRPRPIPPGGAGRSGRRQGSVGCGGRDGAAERGCSNTEARGRAGHTEREGETEGRGTPRQGGGRAGGPGGGSSAPAAAARAAPTVQVVPSAQGPPRVSPGPSGVSSELSHLLSVRWQGHGLISQSDSQGKHRFPRQINERENRKL